MINPISPAVVIPWQGKTYNCEITNLNVASVESELGVSVMFGWGMPGHLSAKPEFYQRAVWLYILMRGKAGATFEQCCDVACGDDALRIAVAIEKAIVEQFLPKIRRIHGAPEAAPESPLATPSDGPASGPAPESTSASETASSGG